jgi:thioester reductase-like protein
MSEHAMTLAAPPVLSVAQKRAMARQMLLRQPDDSAARIAADAASARGLAFRPVASGRIVRHVILTGATGFLGAYLLRDLLRTPGVQVTCLARAADDAAARTRVMAALAGTGAADPGPDRLRALAHDLAAQPGGNAALAEAVRSAEALVNCAARVNFTDRYGQARAANVEAVRHLLGLAQGGLRFHQVSTVAVFATGAFAGRRVTEATPPAIAPFASAHGYCQSKLAAELMLRTAAEAGLGATLYRPGLIGWDTVTGRGNAADFLTHFLAASLRIGALPRIPIALSIAPVGYVAEAIVATVLADAQRAGPLHLLGEAPMPMPEVAAALAAAGRPVDLVGYDDWLARLDADAESPLRPLSLLLPDRFADDADARPPSLFDSLSTDRGVPIDDARTRAGLARLGVALPRNAALNFAAYLKEHLG